MLTVIICLFITRFCSLDRSPIGLGTDPNAAVGHTGTLIKGLFAGNNINNIAWKRTNDSQVISIQCWVCHTLPRRRAKDDLLWTGSASSFAGYRFIYYKINIINNTIVFSKPKMTEQYQPWVIPYYAMLLIRSVFYLPI